MAPGRDPDSPGTPRDPVPSAPSLTRRDVLRRSAAIGVAAPATLLTGSAVAAPTASPTRLPAALPALRADDEIATLAKAMRDRTFSGGNVDAAVAALALAGIPVYADATATEPQQPVAGTVSPLPLLLSQVHNLSLELSARTGTRGERFDAIVPAAEGVPPASFLLAGYVATAKTMGGELARALLGRKDWTRAPEQVYPSIVLALFVADLAREAAVGEENAKLPIGQGILTRRLAANGACSAVQQFIDDAIGDVFGALKVDAPDSGPGEIAADIWNFIVGLGEDVVQGVADVLTAPVMATIRAIAGALAIGTMVVSLLQAWTLRVQADPKETRFGVGSEVVAGAVVAAVDTGGLEEWPADVVDCAATAGVKLPPLNAAGSPIAWKIAEIPPPLIQPPKQPAELASDGKATLGYATQQEDEETAQGEPQEGLMIVEATVERNDLKQIKDTFLGLLFANLPAPVDQWVAQALGGQIAALTDQLTAVAGGYGYDSVKVIYHEKSKTPETENDKETKACPSGTYEVVDITSFLEALMAQSGGEGLVEWEGPTGSWVETFGEKGAFSAVAKKFTALGRIDLGYGILETLVEVNGKVKGSYKLKGNTITLSKISGNFGMFVTSQLDGQAIGGGKVDMGSPVASGSYQYECAGDGLRIYSWPSVPVPIVLAPVE